MAKKYIETKLSKSSTILYLLNSHKDGVKHSQLRNICFNVSSDGRSKWDEFKKANPNKSPQGFYQTWITSMIRKGLIQKDAKSKRYTLSKLGKMNILKPNTHIDNLKRTPKQEIEYLKNRVEILKGQKKHESSRAFKYYCNNSRLNEELFSLKNLIIFHMSAPLDIVRDAVDVVVGDDGFKSKEVIELLIKMKDEGQY